MLGWKTHCFTSTSHSSHSYCTPLFPVSRHTLSPIFHVFFVHYSLSCGSLQVRLMSSSAPSHKQPLQGYTHSGWWFTRYGCLTQNLCDQYSLLWIFQGSRDHVSLTLAYSPVPDTSKTPHKYWLRKTEWQYQWMILKRKIFKCFCEVRHAAK